MAQRNLRSAVRQTILDTDRRFKNELLQALEEPARTLKSKHQAVVRDWTHRPRFEVVRPFIEGNVVEVAVRVAGQHKRFWRYVDEGAKARVIVAKTPRGLRFQGGYSARTAPTAKHGVGTGQRSGGWVRKRQVNHPGVAARGFSKKFSKDIAPEVRRVVDLAFRRVLRRRGG